MTAALLITNPAHASYVPAPPEYDLEAEERADLARWSGAFDSMLVSLTGYDFATSMPAPIDSATVEEFVANTPGLLSSLLLTLGNAAAKCHPNEQSERHQRAGSELESLAHRIAREWADANWRSAEPDGDPDDVPESVRAMIVRERAGVESGALTTPMPSWTTSAIW